MKTLTFIVDANLAKKFKNVVDLENQLYKETAQKVGLKVKDITQSDLLRSFVESKIEQWESEGYDLNK